MQSEFGWLAEWYNSRCNGEWEHHYGIVIKTLDNPGWEMEITGTGLRAMRSHKEDQGELWLSCFVKGGVFSGACDPSSLQRLISMFHEWYSDEVQQA